MKEIIKDLEKLSNRADEVDIRKQNELVRNAIVQLKEVIRDKNLVYLTAPQIGIPIRVFVVNFNGNLKSFINPVISETKGFEFSRYFDPSKLLDSHEITFDYKITGSKGETSGEDTVLLLKYKDRWAFGEVDI
jgi:hypothetical protein